MCALERCSAVGRASTLDFDDLHTHTHTGGGKANPGPFTRTNAAASHHRRSPFQNQSDVEKTAEGTTKGEGGGNDGEVNSESLPSEFLKTQI